jgi:mono/diheme cytochrome c family protein
VTGRRWIVLGVVGLAFAAAAYFGGGGQPQVMVTVTVPVLNDEARAGRDAYDRLCAGCHGVSAAGSPAGPPLVHTVYRPAHHADAAFARAVQRGVRAHHWRFGDMPPLPHVTLEEVRTVVQYVRALQRANGIE